MILMTAVLTVAVGTMAKHTGTVYAQARKDKANTQARGNSAMSSRASISGYVAGRVRSDDMYVCVLRSRQETRMKDNG